MRFRFLIIFLFCISIPIFSQILIVNKKGMEQAGKFMSFYVDSSRHKTINEIARMPSENFLPSAMEKPKFQITSSAIWIKIKLKNTIGQNCYFKFTDIRLDSVILYSKLNEYQSQFLKKSIGYKIPTSTREFKIPTIIFELPYTSDTTTHTYLLRVTSSKSLVLDAHIGTIESMMETIVWNTFFDALYFGVIFVMFLYNLFVFFSTRSRAYGYYIIFLLVMACFMFFVKGYGIYLPDGLRNILYDRINIITISLIEIFATLFCMAFLDLSKVSKKLYYLLIFVIISCFITVLLEFSGLNGFKTKAQNLHVLFFLISLIYVAIYAVVKKIPGSVYYLLSWFFFLSLTSIAILMSIGIIPYHPIGFHLIAIGNGLESILLSLALADRINMLMKENEAILKKSLNDSNNYNEELAQREEELASNEEELRVANEALSHSNEHLEKLLKEEKKLNEQLIINEEELTSKEEELRQSLEELNSINEELVYVNELTLKKERQVSAIFDNTTDIIVSIDADFRITLANQTFKEIYKTISKIDFHQDVNVMEVIPKYQQDSYVAVYNRVFAGEYIYQVTENDGEVFDRYISEEFYSPIRDTNGEIKEVAIFIRDITKRIDAEEKIKKQELLYTAIINSTDDYIVSLDEDLKVVAYNKNYEVLAKTSFQIDLKPGKSCAFELLQPEGHDDYRAIFEKVFKGERVSEVIKRLRGNGQSQELYTRENFNPILNEKGEVKGIAVFISNITDLKLAEEKLRQNEFKFSAVINSTNDLILAVDREFKFHSANDAFLSRIKKIYDKEVIIGVTSALDITPPGLHNEYKAAFARALNGETVTEYFKKTYPNPWIPDEYTEEVFSPIMGEHGEVMGVALFSRDTTLRRNAEEKLKENEKLLAMGQKMAKLGSWVLNLRTAEIKFSDEMYEIYEFPKSKVITTEVFLQIVGDNVYDQNRQKFQYTLKEKKPFNIEYKYKAPSGKVKHIFGIGNPILDEDGEIVEILGIGQDITEIREAEEKLKKQTEELIESSKKTSEYKLMALRSVMNPHFLFNSLNSIQYFIIKNDREHALNYLSTFSKLIRSILNSSIENSNTLSDEMDVLKLYISLETLRFDQKFKTVFKVDKNLEIDNIEIPTLILQPYVENAILHGLYNKLGDTEGKLTIEFKKKGDNLICIVEDNGVGREEAKKIREASRLHKSVGMMVTQERLDLINKNNNLSVKITDLADKEGTPSGTRVEITVLIN